MRRGGAGRDGAPPRPRGASPSAGQAPRPLVGFLWAVGCGRPLSGEGALLPCRMAQRAARSHFTADQRKSVATSFGQAQQGHAPTQRRGAGRLSGRASLISPNEGDAVVQALRRRPASRRGPIRQSRRLPPAASQRTRRCQALPGVAFPVRGACAVCRPEPRAFAARVAAPEWQIGKRRQEARVRGRGVALPRPRPPPSAPPAATVACRPKRNPARVHSLPPSIAVRYTRAQ